MILILISILAIIIGGFLFTEGMLQRKVGAWMYGLLLLFISFPLMIYAVNTYKPAHCVKGVCPQKEEQPKWLYKVDPKQGYYILYNETEERQDTIAFGELENYIQDDNL